MPIIVDDPPMVDIPLSQPVMFDDTLQSPSAWDFLLAFSQVKVGSKMASLGMALPNMALKMLWNNSRMEDINQ